MNEQDIAYAEFKRQEIDQLKRIADVLERIEDCLSRLEERDKPRPKGRPRKY